MREDLAKMRELAREAVEAGALGFATSRTFMHRTSDGSQIPSFDASDAELEAIASGLRDADKGVYRSGQTHDLEHIMTGGDFNYMGELVLAWARITNQFKHLSPELAGEVSVISLCVTLRYTVRTMLHYPQVWNVCQNAIERGMRVGRESDLFFMARYEDVFSLPAAPKRKFRSGRAICSTARRLIIISILDRASAV